MPPVARVTDQTSHGTPLTGAGSPTVLVGGLPAWRVSDFHTCPLVSPGPVPHVGGVDAVGAPTVLVNGLPVAKVGDTIVESGPPNSIAVGCPTVTVG